VRDLGDGFSVRRALPHSRGQMVGPFNRQRFYPIESDTRLAADFGADLRV
jgi:hypothetical protein